ncbi:Ribosomal RNA small subunit methyltransferase D [bacterium HR32]|nr:Ribosomal RNA small subunit methyltransferase D [bacterium HR32]
MRVGAGEAKGKRLRSPRGHRVRPTQDRVREAVFNALGSRVVDVEVLDLFAGVGTLGIEALSRGARRAVFVERDARAAELLRANVRAAGFADRAEVWRSDVLRAVRQLAERGDRFDLVLLDPPYRSGWVPRALRAVVQAGVLRPGGLAVAEFSRGESVEAEGLRVVWRRAYGDTEVAFLEPVEGGEAGGGGGVPGDV